MKINGTQSFSANYNTQQNSFKPSLQNFRVTSSTENCCHQSSPIIMKFHCNPRTLRTPHKWLSKYGFVIIMVPLKRRQPDLSYDMQLLAQFYHSSQINISLGLHYIDTPCMTQYGHSAWHTLNVSTRTHFGYISVFNNQNKHIFLKRYNYHKSCASPYAAKQLQTLAMNNIEMSNISVSDKVHSSYLNTEDTTENIKLLLL